MSPRRSSCPLGKDGRQWETAIHCPARPCQIVRGDQHLHHETSRRMRRGHQHSADPSKTGGSTPFRDPQVRLVRVEGSFYQSHHRTREQGKRHNNKQFEKPHQSSARIHLAVSRNAQSRTYIEPSISDVNARTGNSIAPIGFGRAQSVVPGPQKRAPTTKPLTSRRNGDAKRSAKLF